MGKKEATQEKNSPSSPTAQTVRKRVKKKIKGTRVVLRKVTQGKGKREPGDQQLFYK